MRFRPNEIALSFSVILLAIVLYIGTKSSMPNAAKIFIASLLLTAMTIYIVVIWPSRPADEREEQLLISSSNHAHLITNLILLTGIVVQVINQEPIFWLTLALVGSMTARLYSHFIKRKKQE